MKHVEFFDRDHFEYHFHRVKAVAPLNAYIDFFWETDFHSLWEKYPEGFTDILFPNIGYTFLINLGSQFHLQLDSDERFPIKKDAFLPRHRNISTHHQPANRVFGVKFTLSPLLLEKKVDFSEYGWAPTSLAYLLPTDAINNIRMSASFAERVKATTEYYLDLIGKHPRLPKPVATVKSVIEALGSSIPWDATISGIARRFAVDVRTLQRYFESTTGIPTKKALQLLRIRKAVTALIDSPEHFRWTEFGFFDSSHFYKQLHRFFDDHPAFEKENYLCRLHQSSTKVHY